MAFDQRGAMVGVNLRTTNARIYAAGDVASRVGLDTAAGREGVQTLSSTGNWRRTTSARQPRTGCGQRVLLLAHFHLAEARAARDAR